LRVDFEVEPVPPGPWDLILVFHYLHRPLFEQFEGLLAPGGLLCAFSEECRIRSLNFVAFWV
jgi:hypothetical protein